MIPGWLGIHGLDAFWEQSHFRHLLVLLTLDWSDGSLLIAHHVLPTGEPSGNHAVPRLNELMESKLVKVLLQVSLMSVGKQIILWCHSSHSKPRKSSSNRVWCNWNI